MFVKTKRAAATAMFLGLAFIAVVSLAATGGARRPAAQAAEIQRGKYLVEEASKCPECHTPRDSSGTLDGAAWLPGAPIWITPVKPIPNWPDRAPALAGLPSSTDEKMERVLEKGLGPEGEVLRPPMHPYHMVSADAKAIIAYLKSLPLAKH